MGGLTGAPCSALIFFFPEGNSVLIPIAAVGALTAVIFTKISFFEL
jgi:hypothetical protein